jgi:dihydrofolate synthase/folylpolyglutamate synthase
MQLTTFKQACTYLYNKIQNPAKINYLGLTSLLRVKYLLNLLDNPQNRLKIIHVVGTSGKGSTSYLISLILNQLGFKTGLYLSPHILDIRERIQINNRLISKQNFTKYLNLILPQIKKTEKQILKIPTYFEILAALAFQSFQKEKVDFAVIETGLGGLYDATNTIESSDKTVVITSISKDHTQILGNSLKEIALQKTAVIKKNNPVFSAKQKPEIKKIIDYVSKINQSVCFYPKKNYLKNLNLNLNLKGLHQEKNANLALTVVEKLTERKNFKFDLKKVKKALKTANLIGRFDVKKIKNSQIILDGAHNPAKFKALAETLKQELNLKKSIKNKPDFLIAFKRDKNLNQMLKLVTPIANNIFISEFFTKNQDLHHISYEAEKIKKVLVKKLNFSKNKVKIIKDKQKFLKKYLKKNKKSLVVTGSMYLLGEVYRIIGRSF